MAANALSGLKARRELPGGGFCVLLRFKPRDLFHPDIRVNGLEDQRNAIEARVAHDPAKRIVADVAFA